SLYAVEHAERRILRRARHFLHRQRAAVGIEQHQVRMGATHVDAEAIARHQPALSPISMALTPPSTNSISPTMNSDSSDTRNRITRASSIGTPGRPTKLTTGRVGANASFPTGEPLLLGPTPLTRIRWGASCTA